MAVQNEAVRPRYLAGDRKRLLIDGQWVDALSGAARAASTSSTTT